MICRPGFSVGSEQGDSTQSAIVPGSKSVGRVTHRLIRGELSDGRQLGGKVVRPQLGEES